jgi:hypothetical protein
MRKGIAEMHTVTAPNRFYFGCRSIGDSSNKENSAEQMSIYFSLSENLFLAACSGVSLRGGKMTVA